MMPWSMGGMSRTEEKPEKDEADRDTTFTIAFVLPMYYSQFTDSE